MPCTRRFTIGKHTEFTRALVFHLAVPCLPCYRPALRYHASPRRCMGYFYFYYCFTMCSQLHHVVLSFFYYFPFVTISVFHNFLLNTSCYLAGIPSFPDVRATAAGLSRELAGDPK